MYAYRYNLCLSVMAAGTWIDTGMQSQGVHGGCPSPACS